MPVDEDIVVTIDPEVLGNIPGETEVIIEDGEASSVVNKSTDNDLISSLKSQLAEKQAALSTVQQRVASSETVAQQAIQRSQKLEHEVQKSKQEAVESNRATILTGIAAAKAERESAERDYKLAFEAGDGSAMAKAQSRIADAQYDLRDLERSKIDLDNAPQQKGQTHHVEDQTYVDPIEKFIQEKSAPTQAWLREHTEYLRDPKKNARMVAAHWDAVGNDVPVDSKEYFDHVERYLGLKKSENTQYGQAQSQRRPTAPVAEVTPTSGGMSGQGNRVSLTPAERDVSLDGTLVWNYDDPTGKNRWKKGEPIGIQEMARRKQQLSKDGRYNNPNA